MTTDDTSHDAPTTSPDAQQPTQSRETTTEPYAADVVRRDKLGRPISANSLANLRLWQPGESGNAKGTSGPKLKPHIDKFLDTNFGSLKAMHTSKLSAGEVVARELVLDGTRSGALSSGWRSRKEILDRTDGPVNAQSRLTLNADVAQLVVYVERRETPPAIETPDSP